MPYNADELLHKDSSFTVRGQTFSVNDVRPEVLSAFAPNGSIPKDLSPWESIDMQVSVFLAEDDRGRWKELRERESEPVTIAQMNGILEWLLETQTDRPTNPPSPSASGRGKPAA